MTSAKEAHLSAYKCHKVLPTPTETAKKSSRRMLAERAPHRRASENAAAAAMRKAAFVVALKGSSKRPAHVSHNRCRSWVTH